MVNYSPTLLYKLEVYAIEPNLITSPELKGYEYIFGHRELILSRPIKTIIDERFSYEGP
jgi:hypothetical protein